MSTKQICLSIILACFLGCLGCGDPTPINDQAYKDPQGSRTPLSKDWQQQFNVISNPAGRKDFETSIKELKPENRDAFLEILKAISDPTQDKNFLNDLTTYDKPTQAHLINIILYLKKENENLLLKVAQHPERLSMLDKLKLFEMINGLEPKDKELVAQFEQALEN